VIQSSHSLDVIERRRAWNHGVDEDSWDRRYRAIGHPCEVLAVSVESEIGGMNEQWLEAGDHVGR
jgi:hypothetical protein